MCAGSQRIVFWPMALPKTPDLQLDLLRACMKRANQISPESIVLEYQALERDRRLQGRSHKQVPNN